MSSAAPPRDYEVAHDNNVQRLDAFKKHCKVCGQVFDTRDQDQVFHHDAEPHKQLERAS